MELIIAGKQCANPDCRFPVVRNQDYCRNHHPRRCKAIKSTRTDDIAPKGQCRNLAKEGEAYCNKHKRERA